MANDTLPHWDRKMQQRLAGGEAAALGELYDRFAPLVHGLAFRVLADDAAADRTTRDVFGHVWENPHAYDPRAGRLRSWVADVTQQLATGRLRQQRRKDGGGASTEPPSADAEERIEEQVRAAATAARADYILTSMPTSLRDALELTWFRRHDYRETARRLGISEDEARRRLRLGLQLLSSARSAPLPARARVRPQRRCP